MSSAIKRLRGEARDLAKNGQDPEIYLEMDEESPDKWHAEVLGPEDTPYAGGKFVLLIKCPTSYPIEPPSVTFLTKTFHPNVEEKLHEDSLPNHQNRIEIHDFQQNFFQFFYFSSLSEEKFLHALIKI